MNDGSHYWITYKPHIGPGMGVRAYIRWLGQIDTWGNSIYLQRCEDGCILIRVAKGYLYPGEYHAVLEALTKLVKDYDTMRAIQSVLDIGPWPTCRKNIAAQKRISARPAISGSVTTNHDGTGQPVPYMSAAGEKRKQECTLFTTRMAEK